MLEGFPLGSYLLLVEYTGRLFRDGNVTLSAELSGTLEHIGTTTENCRTRLERLRTGRLLGRFFAASRERLRGTIKSLWKRFSRLSTTMLKICR
jgi:hypothetical protein